MNKIITILFLVITSNVFSQKLTVNDLTKLKETNLNQAETLLANNEFEFKEVNTSDENEKYYAFGFNLDKYGEKADEYLVISINETSENVTYVWYQLEKTGWSELKKNLISLGYKKTKTESDSDGSLTTEYSNSVFNFSFNVGKTRNDDNESVFLYSLSIR